MNNGLPAGKLAYYRVRAYNALGFSPYSNVAATDGSIIGSNQKTTPGTNPTTPTLPTDPSDPTTPPSPIGVTTNPVPTKPRTPTRIGTGSPFSTVLL